jgi:hypothetical protein
MEGLKSIIIPIIDYGLRIAGCGALVVIAFFLAWWAL